MSPLPPHIKKNPPPTENSITRDAEWKSIEELGEIIGGKGLKKEELLRKGSIGCIHYGQIYKSYEISATETISFCTEETASKCIKVLPGDIVFTKVGENKEDICKPVVWLGKEPIYTGAGAVVIRLKEQCNPLFLAYYSQSQNFRTVVKNNASSTTVTNMSISSFKNIRVLLPPLPEQRRIVAFLDEAFHNTAHLTEKITRSLHETQKLKNAFLHQAFTPANTVGWEYYPLEEVFTTRQGYTPKTSEASYWKNGTIPFVTMEDIRKYGQRLEKAHRYVTEVAIKGSGVFPAGSFIISTSATIGEHALITVPFLTNQRFTCLILKPAFEKRLEREFIFYYLYMLGQWCRRHVNSGTHAQVKMPLFRKFSFPIPPLPEQRRIVAFLDEAFHTIATLTTNAHNRLAEAQKLKNAYLQKAFESPEHILTLRDPRP